MVKHNDVDIIYITPTLYERLAKNVEGDKEKKHKQTEEENSDFVGQPTSFALTVPEMSFADQTPTQQKDANTFPTFDPNFILRHAAFDPSILLYGIRGEYERKFQQYQQLFRQKWEDLERMNRDLHKANSTKLSSEVARVENQYFREHSHLLEQTPCQDAETSVLKCYLNNQQKPLLCRGHVKRFTNCIEENRMKFLKEK